MNEQRWERWGAASGYLIFALGIAGAAFERGAPPANAPAGETLAFFVHYRRELLAQSLMFVLSSGVYLWFFGSLRSFLHRAEGGTGGLSTVAYGAGVIWAGIQMIFQGAQVAVAMGATEMDPALAGLMGDFTYALSVIAYVPQAVMLAAVAAVALGARAMPAWLGWLSAVAAAANLVESLGIAVESPLLVPGGAMTYVLYLLLVVWLVAVTTAMVRRLGKAASRARACR